MKKLKSILLKIKDGFYYILSLDTIEIIQQSMISILPIIFAGSIFQILQVLSDPSIGLVTISFLTPFTEAFNIATKLTMGMISLYIVICYSNRYAKINNIDSTYTSIAVVSIFLIMTKSSGFGSKEMFPALVCAIFGTKLYHYLSNSRFVIRMPQQVSKAINKSFKAVIPTALVIIIAFFISFVLNFDLNSIVEMIFKPFVKSMDSLLGYVIVVTLVQILWCFGIHGMNSLGGFISPIMLQLLLLNYESIQGGVDPAFAPNIFVENFQRTSIGIANLWPLVFYLCISKKEQLRKIGFMSFVPAIFGISEPVVFGVPIAFNKYLAIPWVLSVTISAAINYIIMTFNVINRFYIGIPWATPTPLLVYASTGGDIRSLILPLISFIVGMIIYYPFIKKYEKTLD